MCMDMGLRRRCLLAIWLDGFRTDYLDRVKTPFIYQLSEKATIGEYEPLLAFTGIGASILTGLTPMKHGIWVEFFYDPENSPFKWTSKLSSLEGTIDVITDKMSETQLLRVALTFLAFKASKWTSQRTYMPMALMTPLKNLHLFGTLSRHMFQEQALAIPTLFDALRQRSIPFRVLSESEMRDSEIFKEAICVDQDARLVFVQLGELDIVGHAKGPNSKEVKQSLRTIDTRVQRIVEEHRSNFRTDIFIFSDHGMVEVKNTVDILSELRRSGLKEGQDFITFLDSTLARFWTLKPGVKEQMLKALPAINGGRILSVDDMKLYQIPADRRYGDVIWLAYPGTLILPNYYQGSKLVHGMHGYAPEAEGLRTPFIICSEDAEPRRVMQIATPMDIFTTIAALLDIEVPWPVEGRLLISLP